MQIIDAKNLTREKLPPTLDSLLFHLQRANGQSLEKCLYPHFGTVMNVWVKSREILGQEKTVWNAVPKAIVELVCCKCQKGCKTNACGCKKVGLTCTDACICSKT